MIVKKILISTRVERDNSYGEVRDAIDQRLVKWVSDLGYSALLVPNCLSNPVRWAESLSPAGILLSGGNDIDPATYGQPVTNRQNTNRNRDRTEVALIRFAVSHHLPVVGICRGMQMINVAFEGSLIQTPENNATDRNLHLATVHKIKLNQNFFLTEYHNTKISVNSFHKQVLYDDCLAEDLIPMAYAEDGVIEAIKHKNYPIIGLQWHPERPGSDHILDRLIITHFLGNPTNYLKQGHQ